MKNPSQTELAMLSARAHALMRPLPPLSRGDDGALSPQSREQFAALARAPRIARLAVYYGLSLAALAAACSRPFGATADFIYFQF